MRGNVKSFEKANKQKKKKLSLTSCEETETEMVKLVDSF